MTWFFESRKGEQTGMVSNSTNPAGLPAVCPACGYSGYTGELHVCRESPGPTTPPTQPAAAMGDEQIPPTETLTDEALVRLFEDKVRGEWWHDAALLRDELLRRLRADPDAAKAGMDEKEVRAVIQREFEKEVWPDEQQPNTKRYWKAAAGRAAARSARKLLRRFHATAGAATPPKGEQR